MLICYEDDMRTVVYYEYAKLISLGDKIALKAIIS